MSAHPKSFKAGDLFGAFRLNREIAHGGMGYVFEATELALDRRVAIKIISEELRKNEDFVKRFLREAKTLARVSHPNVVSVFTVGEHEGVHFLSMDYVDGGNLREFLASGEFFFGDLCDILRKIASGLAAIHANGVVHRDIKLSNVLVAQRHDVRIGDFGLAKIEGDAAGDITETGQLIGTVQYMAPELLSGEPYSEKSDIFSLGLLFFEGLVGYNPFFAKTTIETADRIRKQELSFPAEVQALIPAELRTLVLGMTAKQAWARVATMKEVCAQLDAAILACTFPMAQKRWPDGFKVTNLSESIDLMLEKGATSPTEVSLVLARAQEKSGAQSGASVVFEPALILECLAVLRSPAFSLPQDLNADDIPNIVMPVEKPKAASKKKKTTLAEEEDIAIDPQILASEQKKHEISEMKATAPKLAPKPVQLERKIPLPPQREERKIQDAPKPAMSFRFGSVLGGIFSPKKLLLAGFLVGGIYLWGFAGVVDAVVANAPDCKSSAEGFAGVPPYKDMAFPPGFAPFREIGLVCDSGLNCWARSRPWLSFSAVRDHLFPQSPWGEAYTNGSLMIFRDSTRKLLRVRNTEAGQQVRLSIGIEECVFSLREEKVPLLRYHLASVAGAYLEGLIGGDSVSLEATPSSTAPSVAPGKSSPVTPEKKEGTWNQKAWDKFMNFIYTGK